MAMERANLIDAALAHYLEERPTQAEQVQFAPVEEEIAILKCPKCGSNMILKERRQGRGKYISCMGYPTCTNVIWFPEAVEDVEILNEICNQVNATFFNRNILHKYVLFVNKLTKIICFQCTENMRKLKFKLVRNVIPLYGTSYTTCIGCDTTFNEMLNIKEDCIRQNRRANYIQNNTRDTSSSSSSTSQLQVTQRQQPASNSTRSVWNNNDVALNRTSDTSGRSTQNHNSQPNRSNTVNRNTTMSNNTNGARSVRNNNDVGLIRTSGTSGRSAQNHNSNVSQPNRPVNRTVNRTVNRNTNNRGNFDSWDNSWDNFNTDDFNSSWDGSNQSASSNSHNATNRSSTWGNIDNDAEIMCNCHQNAIQLTVRKEGPNKGK